MPSGPPTSSARPPRVPPPAVTASGLRAGDPFVLAALVGRDGAAVLAYADAVAARGTALRLAAAVFAELRATLIASPAGEQDPHAELLAATRRVAALRAENPFRPDEHPRPRERTDVCAGFPRLLTSWADHRLPREDAERLRGHVEECPDCAALNVAFDRAETAFRDGPRPSLTPEQAGALVAAMALVRGG